MSHALVTGASGFIGVHLVEQLVRRGDRVTALVRRTTNVERLRPFPVRLVYGDVTDAQSLGEIVAGHDVVYHLAGLTMALSSADLTRVNAGGTRNILAACAAQSTPPTLVIVSSIAAAGPSRKGQPRVESDPPRPVSHYGRSKLAAELAAAQLAAIVPTTIVRPPIVFGEGDRASLPLFSTLARWGIHMVPSVCDPRFSLIHAADLAAALLLAARHGTRLATPPAQDGTAGLYYVADDEAPTYAELGRRIGAAVGRSRIRVVRNLKTTVWTVAGITDLISHLRRRPNVFGIDKAREATAGSWVCSDAALRRDVGFLPAANLATRLAQTAQWYLEQGWIRPTRTTVPTSR
jgi:nucleoside-diphosphate-sugar epimerase